MVAINLLPWREEAKKQRQNQFNLMAGASLLVAIAISLLVIYFISSKITLQDSKNRYLQSEISLLDDKIVEIKELRRAKDSLRKRMDLIERLQNTRNLSTHLLDSLAAVTSSGVYLTKVERKGNSLWIEGLTESNNHLANMLRNIENSQWYKDPLVQQINTEDTSLRQLNAFYLRVDINSTIDEGGQ
ncbi:PilN domain-containing protein [Psychrobium sp. 1_MG-2023]|uniref:PilN domain-containing protein n=1 Tax=Psychrobium sp. 1_MG-2023 TaxID=3062624 RepID=UPI000C3389BB|nr:PilN domain-containing protein [Psychrobium sp. 1_MG-2023]MDP2560998.1 PilN domain-containing protein [Psychrobium sp. 1_MG-2023]PKF58292.1 fimbrial protein [Alteromonadales bacterium alter-6D02]